MDKANNKISLIGVLKQVCLMLQNYDKDRLKPKLNALCATSGVIGIFMLANVVLKLADFVHL
jgi:hypothetical protein